MAEQYVGTQIPDAADIPLVRALIRPRSGLFELELTELWRQRELLYFLVWRDLKARYKQTLVGAAWAIIQPLITMLVFTVIFGGFAKLPSDGIPYALFAYTGLLPWNLFSQSLNRAAISLVTSTNLVTKVYFPRLFIVLSSVGIPLVDFFFSFLILIPLMVRYGVYPGVRLLALPVFILLAILASVGMSVWLAPLHVKYRDIGQSIRFLTQIWLYATPVAYPLRLVPGKWRLLYALNPLVSVVEGFRWSLVGNRPLDMPVVILGAALLIGLLISGLVYFKNCEQTFADVI